MQDVWYNIGQVIGFIIWPIFIVMFIVFVFRILNWAFTGTLDNIIAFMSGGNNAYSIDEKQND